MSTKFAGVKGMNDLRSPQIEIWQRIEGVARTLFARYGYSEIRTPIVEDTALFVRSVGEVTEIVGKEMYTFTDKGDRSISMRPEGTAPAARAYIEHSIANAEPLTRWFYMGPMFRYERMKTGRYRQFYQLGAEAYGALDPAQDVEVIALCDAFFKAIGVPDVVLHLNSLGDGSTRPAYLEQLKLHFAPLFEVMSAEAKLAFEKNTMRLLDSKEPALQDAIASAPAILDSIDEASKKHFDDVRRMLTKLGIPFELDRRLVRGLDYYTRTTFEFIYQPKGENALGTAGTVCGGGRYDRLVHELGGPEKPAVGFAMGLDRLVLLVESLKPVERGGPTLFIGTFEGPERDDAIALVMKLRNEGFEVDFDPRGGNKLGKQKERASKVNAAWFAPYGDAEHKSGKLKLDNMRLPKDAPKETVEISLDGLPAWLNAAGKRPS